ncbi:Sec-independent protein translocase protein TatB [Rhodosalinus sp.]|uniref:Sec-independent protein translocase protein TatB n=1 Tax=Rhodosalinus sp. TaxID=2047741 RepID=UPI003568B1E9
MLDLGWTELLVIGIVALIVVGPKDLPVLFRNVGRFMGKARGMAREFSRAMNDAAEESGVSEATRGFKDATKGFKDATSAKSMGLDGVEESLRETARWDPDSETAKLARDRAAEAQARRDALREKTDAGATPASGDSATDSPDDAPRPDRTDAPAPEDRKE